MSRVILIHHHIFKNAGTSFNYALESFFGDRYFEFDLPDSRVVTCKTLDAFLQSHPQALAVSGHQICMPTPQGKDYQTISSVLLRNPLSRIRSIYQFERQQHLENPTPGAVKAKELGFKEFVLWQLDTQPGVICNYQTLYCSRTSNHSPTYIATEENFKIAVENLKKCAIVGTVERYNDTLALAQEKLSPIYPDITLASTHLNVTTQSMEQDVRNTLIEDLGETLVDRLIEMNQLDEALYKLADDALGHSVEIDRRPLLWFKQTLQKLLQ